MTATANAMRYDAPTPTGHDCPPWASGVRRSVTAGEDEAIDAMDESVTEHEDPQTQLKVLHGPGVHVVAVEQPFTSDRYHQAIDLLHRLKAHPLEIAALALPPNIAPPPDVVMQLADQGITVVRDEGESALARASNYIQGFLALRAEGLAHLRQSMGLDVQSDHPRRMRSHAPR